MENYGQRIKAYRKKQELTQTEFGKLFYPPVHKSVVCHWEHCSRWAGSVRNKRRLKELINFQPDSVAHMTLGEKIKLRRIELGYTQYEFSQILFPNPSRTRIADWENSKHNPAQKYKPQLMEILDIYDDEYQQLANNSKLKKEENNL